MLHQSLELDQKGSPSLIQRGNPKPKVSNWAIGIDCAWALT